MNAQLSAANERAGHGNGVDLDGGAAAVGKMVHSPMRPHAHASSALSQEGQ